MRWLLKKTSRRTVAATVWLADLLQPRGGARTPRVRVLTYHRFGATPRDPFCVGSEDFEAQMAWLAAEGLAVSLADVEAFVRGTKTMPDAAALVTIDDGCPSVFTRALPILQRHRIPAVVFVPAGEIADREPAAASTEDAPHDRLGWDALRTLADAGVTVGSHAWTHRSLGRLTAEEAEREIADSRRELERRLGRPVTAFAYPYGTRADYNGDTATSLRRAGYTCAFTSQHGAVTPGADPFELPRIKVEGGEGPWMFRTLVHGGLDPWRYVDRTLWRLQQSGE